MKNFENDAAKQSMLDDLDALQNDLLIFMSAYEHEQMLDDEEVNFLNSTETLIDAIETLGFHYVNEC